MKKFSKLLSILCAGAMVVSTFAFAACQPESNDDPNKGEEQPEVTLTLDKTTASVEAGQTVTINVTTNSDKAVTAASSSANATVTVSGKVVTVTGVTAGTATITVSVDGKNATCAITVTAAPEASLNLGAEYVVLEETYVTNDDTDDITAVELDVDYSGTGTIQATVADAEVATANYADGTVTLTGGTKFGKTTLTVTDGEKTATCTVEFVTFGLSYGKYTLYDGDGNEIGAALEVSDTGNRASTDIYIPGYYYNLDADTFLPVQRIKKESFKNNKNVTTLYTGDNVSLLDMDAFNGCTELTTVTTGIALSKIHDRGFQNCSKLATMNWAEGGVIQEIGQSGLLGTGFVEITLPATITKFNASMFNGCANLEIARLLGEAPQLFGGTFQSCLKLKEVWLNKALKTIDSTAFYYAAAGVNFGKFENGEDNIGNWGEDAMPDFDCKIVFNGSQEEWDAIKKADGQPGAGFKWIYTSTNPRLSFIYNADFAALLAK